MGLEWRGHRSYFYRKKRIGGRVVSVYGGSGMKALLLAALDANRQRERHCKRLHNEMWLERETERFELANNLISSFAEEVKALEEALYLVNGYHQHSRQWRKKNV